VQPDQGIFQPLRCGFIAGQTGARPDAMLPRRRELVSRCPIGMGFLRLWGSSSNRVNAIDMSGIPSAVPEQPGKAQSLTRDFADFPK